MAFARAVGEIGAIVLISGNLPYKTEVSSVFIFLRIQSGDPRGAAAVAVVLLTISFVVLLVVGGVRGSRRGTSVPSKLALRVVALGYLVGDPARAARADVLADVRRTLGAAWEAISQPEHGARVQGDARGDGDRGAAEHGLRRSSAASRSCGGASPARGS